jgi:hypothetical protein
MLLEPAQIEIRATDFAWAMGIVERGARLF